MKKIFIVLAMLLMSSAFGQGNFTVEWESPAGWRIANSPNNPQGILKLNNASNVYHLAFEDVNDFHNVRFYNGSTHALDYSWTWTGTVSGFYASGISGLNYGELFSASKFDVNGDGVNEIIQYRGPILGIVNPVNGNVLHTITDNISYVIDIDGDGFLELILTAYPSYSVRIISTTAQSVSIENNSEIVKDYNLKQNYPNPFNPSTTIEYTLNKNSDVKIIIYNILGKELNTLVNQKQISGTYKLNLNGNDLSSGTYFYSLIVDGVAESKKMILIK